ncbi:MAG: hypothetical protein J6N46_05730 [Bacteroidales bacterium]|nr:hypothetical protein [Bacteroidales bacterium]MBO6249249.1 hypothetical protein [Bacteroidales bacterium]
MAKKDLLKGQLSTGSNALPGGLQSLVRGGTPKVKEDMEDEVPQEEKKSVGRPKKNEDMMHTSLVIDRELYKRVKTIGFEQGRDLKSIVNEAIENWVAQNS